MLNTTYRILEELLQITAKLSELNPNDAKVYYLRGILKHILGEKDSGCLDFSKASELGYEAAYDAIKELCN